MKVRGSDMTTVGPLVCEICFVMCNRFPYHLMLEGMEKPVTVCRSCYRVALVIQWMHKQGGFEIVDGGDSTTP